MESKDTKHHLSVNNETNAATATPVNTLTLSSHSSFLSPARSSATRTQQITSSKHVIGSANNRRNVVNVQASDAHDA